MAFHKSTIVTILLACVVAWAAPAYGQSDRGALTGTVTDPSGAVVAGAKITLTNTDTGEVREATTTEQGTFNLQQLSANPYRLTVEAAGFKTSTIEEVKIAVQITRNTDIVLETGEISESVTISAEAAVLNTDNNVQQLNVTERQVRELPLVVAAESGGRSPLSFIFLDSSITPASNATGSQGTNASNFRVNGGQGLGTDILIDGAGTRRGENGTFFSEVAPGPNAFQEFTVSTNNYSAEFGNSSGGIVNFTIKQGSNDFHGEAYAFFINEALNANIDRNRLTGLERPLDRQRDYGFSVGGPVFLPRFGEGGPAIYNGRNKTFFFFNYGAYRTTQTESVDITVPTLRMRSGDFSELLTDPYVLQFFGGPVQIFDPSQTPGQRTAIPGNRLDLYQGGRLISVPGRALTNFFPLPNQTGLNGSSVFRNYLASTQAQAQTDYYVTKITQAITEKQQLNFSYTFRKLPSQKGPGNNPFPRFPGPFVAEGRWQQQFRSYYARLQHDYTITPTLLNHFNAGFSRSDVENRNYSSERNNLTIGGAFQRGATASTIGIPAGSTQDIGLPLVGFPGYGDILIGDDPRAYQPAGSTFFDNRTADNAVQLTDFVTYSRGRQTMKFGGDLRFQQLNVAAKFDIGGNFNFRSNQTANTNDFNQGWPIASLITGRPEFSFNSLQTTDPGFRFFSPSVFFQDDIKVTPSLTINLGVRYDYSRPRTESGNQYRSFDPDVPNPAAGGRRGAIVSAGGQGIAAINNGLVEPDFANIGPRFGFAYSFNNRTVVRGGYGIYYAPLIYNDFGNGGQVGYNPGSLNINGGFDAGITLDNYPSLPVANPTDQVVGQLDRTDVDYFNKNFKLGRTAQYNLEIQRELPYNFAISASYVGSKGTRLRSNFNPTNIIPFEALRLGNALLSKPLSAVTPDERAFAQRVGVTIPASNDAVYPGFNSNVAQALRPFPQYPRDIIERLESEGQSFYNAGKLDVQRRFTNGIQFGLSYTFSKLITDAAEDLFGDSPLNSVLQNPYDRRSVRTISPNSIPHSLVFNYLIELPFGKGQRFLDRGGVVDRLVGGFQISAIHRYRSGPALVPFLPGGGREFLDFFGVGGNLRPNVTGQDFYTDTPAGGVNYRYLNPAAFSRPPDFRNAPTFADPTAGDPNRRTPFPIGSPEYAAYYANPNVFFGNAAPTYNNLRAQPFFTEDLSILKKTRITETTYFEIRAEFFNLFNRGRFGLPDVNVDNPSNFGISGRNGDIFQPRRIQVGGRFVF